MDSIQFLPNIAFSLNNVLPIFLLIAAGYVLKRQKFLNEEFSRVSNKIVFNIALPAMIFESIYNSNLCDVIDRKLILFCLLAIILFFLLLTGGACVFIKDKTVIGAFVQGAFRSNYLLIGLPLINSLYETSNEHAIQKSSFIVSIIIPVFNILSIIILSIHSRSRQELRILKNLRLIVTNPLIIAVLIAVATNLLNIKVPLFFSTTIAYISDIAIPLALLDIGSCISISRISKTFRYALIATFLKIVFAPSAVSLIAYWCNFRGPDLVILYILFASPTAVASYIMAKNMDNNEELAASIIFFSTAGSIITVFTGIFIFKTAGLI
jgi:predicted permease